MGIMDMLKGRGGKECPNCGLPWEKGEKYCRRCGASAQKKRREPDVAPVVYGPPPMERERVNNKKVCPNCEGEWIEGDRYCRICGARAERPMMIPDEDACIYGPPPSDRIHKCRKCKFTWQTKRMIDRQRYCPKCGGECDTWEDEHSYER